MIDRPALVAVLAAAFAAFLGYQGVAVLAPFYVASLHADATVVGATTTVFMITSTLTAIGMITVRTSGDPRPLAIAAILLLGLPCFAIPLFTAPGPVLVLNGLRGIGFGMIAVLLASAAGLSASSTRRGLVLGMFGVITSGFAALGQSTALAIQKGLGFRLAFLMAGAITTVAIVPALALRGRGERERATPGPIRIQHLSLLLPLAFLFLVVTSTYGAVVSFVPERMQSFGTGAAFVFFLVLAVVAPVSRLATGWLLDRFVPTPLFLTGIALGVIGLVMLARADVLLATLLAPCLYALSFGALSTGTQVTMMRRVTGVDYNLVNGLFNAAWNAGMAAGGIGFGALALATGYSGMFQLAGFALCLAFLALRVDQTVQRQPVLSKVVRVQ